MNEVEITSLLVPPFTGFLIQLLAQQVRDFTVVVETETLIQLSTLGILRWNVLGSVFSRNVSFCC